MPSFVENINKLAEKLDVIVESNDIFDDKTLPILEEIAELDLKEAIWDLRKGNYLGNRKVDINLALNRQGITEDLIEKYPDQAEDIWTDLSGVVLYDRCDVTFVDGEVITINFEFDGNPTTVSTHGDLLIQLSSNSAFLAKLEGTLISGFNWDVVGEIVRVYDVIGQISNIERIQLHAVSGDYIEQTPIYYWAKTSSSFQAFSTRLGDIVKLGNDIDSIILLANRINEILELHARIPELIDTYTDDTPNGDLTIYNTLDELMAIYTELEALIVIYNDIKSVGTNYIQSVAIDLQGANNIGTVSNDIANINNVATNVVPNINDILLGNTIKGVILSTYNSFSEAISNADTLGKSLIIDKPVDLGGATIDCLGVGLVWLSEGNIISNGTLTNVGGINGGNYQLISTDLAISLNKYAVINIRWFGGNTGYGNNNSTVLQAINDAWNTSGGAIYIPGGSGNVYAEDNYYLCDTTFYPTKPITIQGDGSEQSNLAYTGNATFWDGSGNPYQTTLLNVGVLGSDGEGGEYFKTGSKGFIFKGTFYTNNSRIAKFNTLFDWQGGYYHKFYKTLFDRFSIGFINVNVNNILFDGCRVHTFDKFVEYKGGLGPFNFINGSIEHMTKKFINSVGSSNAIINIENTYIENNPTVSGNLALGLATDSFDSAQLVTGTRVNLKNNYINLRGYTRILNMSGGAVDFFNSTGNLIFYNSESPNNTLSHYAYANSYGILNVKDSWQGDSYTGSHIFGSVNVGTAEVYSPQGELVEYLPDWENLLLENGHIADTTPRYRKVKKRVYLSGSVDSASATGSTIATLPEGFRPTQNVYITSTGLDTGTGDTVLVKLRVTLAGYLVITNPTYTYNNISLDGVAFYID